MTAGERHERTELVVRPSVTAFFNSEKSVGGNKVLVPTYLMELKARGNLPTSENLSFNISSGHFVITVSTERIKSTMQSARKSRW